MVKLKPKVIGNGMIAVAFSSSCFQRSVVIFASGVSNSGEVRSSEFEREEALLRKVLEENPGSEIVYFSSTSVLFAHHNAYSRHKKNMEELIANSAESFFIFRLPQVVGMVLNNTLVSYLARSCMERHCVEVYTHAVRNLIDIEDVVRIVGFLVNHRLGLGSAQTLASGCNVRVPDLVNEVRGLLGVPCEFNFVPKGDDQTVSVDFLREHLNADDPVLRDDYWVQVLRKNVPLLKERILGEKKDPY